ncbi:MAG: nucleoside hydrolase [Caldilineaceae bacterium]|nr:nucleoside hydrolase [Caldilineaceae bacterium]
MKVLGVTCVVGNQRLPQVVENTLKTLDVAAAPEIPVAAGAALPLIEKLRPPMLLHGDDGMANLGLPSSSRQPADIHAVELLRVLLEAATQPVTLIALAPLTNIALFLRLYPRLAETIDNLTIMGGTFADPGNTTPLAEFNIRHDPEAAAIVLESGLPIRLYTLDVFRRVAFTQAEAAILARSTARVAQTAGHMLMHSCGYFRSEAALIGDAGAVASVIDPTGVTSLRHPIHVELAGTARGQTIVDRRPPSSRQRLEDDWCTTSACEIQVITQVDAPRYRQLFAQTVGAAWPLS